MECAQSAPTWSRRAHDDERGCGVTPTPKRVTEVERADRVNVCDRSTVVERSWQRCSESVGFSAPRLARLRRDARCIDEIFTIRPLAHPVNAEMKSSFVGHHLSATFELRTGVVKAEARRVERSESLYDVEHSSTLIM